MKTRAPRTRTGRQTKAYITACRRLVRYMHEKNLRVGDHFPPQETLRQELHFGHGTLSTAMGMLVKYGMVTRKCSQGTKIIDREAVILGLWTVALPIYSHKEQSDNIYISTLLRFLQGHLLDVGCQYRVYPRQSAEDRPAAFSDYPGLNEDLKAGRLNAILSPASLESPDVKRAIAAGVPVCRIGSNEAIKCGVILDVKPLVEQGLDLLMKRGCGRLAIVSPRAVDHPSFWPWMREALTGLNPPPDRAEILHAGADTSAGRSVAYGLLERGQEQRPDGLVVVGDNLAVSLTRVLWGTGYHPQLVVQTHKQAPMAFALPVIRFTYDLNDMARQVVEMTLERLHTPGIPDERRWARPRLEPDAPQGDAGADGLEHPMTSELIVATGRDVSAGRESKRLAASSAN